MSSPAANPPGTPGTALSGDAAVLAARLRPPQLLALSAYWFASNLHWGALLLILVPSQVRAIAPHDAAQVQGRLVGLGAIVALVVPLLAGALSDRCTSRWGRRRPYLAAGTVIDLFGLLVLWSAGSSRSLGLYLIGYLIVQLGNSIATGPYNGIIPDLVPPAQRGEASGYMAVMTQSGTILGALSAGLLLGAHQVAASYGVIAAVVVVFLSVTLVGVRERPLAHAPEPLDWRAFLQSLWIDPRQHPDFAWVWVTRGLVTMGMWTLQPFIQYYLADMVGVKNPEKTTGVLMAIILVGATVTGLFGGRISDRIGRKPVVYVANTVVAVASVAFVFSHSLLYTFIIGLVYGLGYGAYYSVDWALGCDVLPHPEEAGKDMGVWHISMVLPQAIAAPIAGSVLTAFGTSVDVHGMVHYSLPGYVALFVLAAFYLMLGAVLLRNVRGVR